MRGEASVDNEEHQAKPRGRGEVKGLITQDKFHCCFYKLFLNVSETFRF